ncbi:MAG: hypothetical protein GY937_13570, partial [bacterium]|nr:hypothetical protein [bacterium]
MSDEDGSVVAVQTVSDTDGADDAVTSSDAVTSDNAASVAAMDADGQNVDSQTTDADLGTGDTGDSLESSSDGYADFTLPEDVQLDTAVLAEAAPLFKEWGLSQDQAQQAVDFYAKQVQAISAAQTGAHDQLMSEWRINSENDSDIGGDNLPEAVALAQAAINKFGTPELKQLLHDHGVGNHVEVIRVFRNVGKLTAE